MSDYFKSALGYLNSAGINNEYVGQTIEINNVKLRVNRLLAEGGCALVFAVEDVATGKEYALKRLIAVDEETNRSILKEIETLKKLSSHPNVIQFLHARQIEKEDNKIEYLLVTEYCPGGNLADILRNIDPNTLTLAQICKVMYQATRAVHLMHNQEPEPYIHRDIKLENFLIGFDGLVKLCDFGSTSTQQILPDSTWNAQKRATLEDQMAKYTTPMYRAPEMLDTWNNEPIGPPVDCWALGCILYALLTLRHPFPEGNKLAIINAKYPPLPPNPRYACLFGLVHDSMKISPTQRLPTSVLLERLAAIAESNNFDPREAAKIEIPIKPQPPPRPTPPSVTVPPRDQTVQSTSLFSSLKGGAGSILRNLKDTSSKVMHSVQQTMARTELDASYLTSRLLIMPYPADGIESAYRANHVEDVRAFLQTRHPTPARIQFYNLSRGRSNVPRLPGRHVDCSFAYASSDSNGPLLAALYQICQDVYKFLNDDFHNVVVMYCTDGLRASAMVACSLLIYARALNTTEEAIGLFTTRRCQPPQLQPSELRSIYYMSLLSTGKEPHTKPLALRSLIINPVPLFTKAKDGCRPYIEIYSNGALVFSTKRAEYEDMRLFGIAEGKVCLILDDATVRGDVTLMIYHARQQLGRIIGIKIASVNFHTGYVPITESTLAFDKNDLDDQQEIGGKFRLMINVMALEDNSKSRIPAPWEAEASIPVPDPLFGSTLEMEETLENFRTNRSTNDKNNGEKEKEEVEEEEEEEEKRYLEPEEEDIGFQEADLLNLGISNTPRLDIFTSSSQSESDLLGEFGINPIPPTTDLLFDQEESRNETIDKNVNNLLNNDFLFDPFGNDAPNNYLGVRSTTAEETIPRNSSVPNFPAQAKDPFANLAGNLGAGLTSSWNGTPINSSSPSKSNTSNGTGSDNNKTKSGTDAFEDLLGSQGYNFTSSRKSEKSSPKTINQMRKVEAAKTMDPELLKIAEWTEGKKGNLRALLCSLHTVLWPDADRWRRYEMHQLVTAADVKKAYRKACLAVHPDKQAGTANENIAKLIFMELNNAWGTFENDSSQQNLFS